MSNELFKSIYDNYHVYQKIAADILKSKANIYKDEVVSDCIEKIVTDIAKGKLTPEDICYKNTSSINHSYFTRLVTNKAIDVIRSRKYKVEVKALENNIEDKQENVIFDEIDRVDELDFVLNHLEKQAVLSKEGMYFNELFYLTVLLGVSNRKISREVKICRNELNEKKRALIEIIKSIVMEGRQNKTIKKARPIIGFNTTTTEQLEFSSISQAAKAGYRNIKAAIESNRQVKGFHFRYVDTDTIENSLEKPSEGLGDVAAKVIHSKFGQSIAKALSINTDKNCVECNERRKAWNNLTFKHINQEAKRFFTEEEYEKFRPLVEKRSLTQEDIKIVEVMYPAIFSTPFQKICGSCGGGRAARSRWLALVDVWKFQTN